MAYSVALCSIPQENFATFRENDDFTRLMPSKIADVSHILCTWVPMQPLASLLREAIDGGEDLSPFLTHRFRPPRYHDPAATRDCINRLRKEWESLLHTTPDVDDGWFSVRIRFVIEIFGWAAQYDEVVVSALDDLIVDTRCDQKVWFSKEALLRATLLRA